MLKDNDYWITFLNSAERQLSYVVHSAMGNDKFRLLPPEFNNRRKILAFFKNYWSKTYAEKMLCNLKTKEINNKLYIVEGDIGPTPEVRYIRINQCSRSCLAIHTKLGFEWEKEEELRPVTFIIKKYKRKFIIQERIYDGYDFRFEECK